MSEHAPLIIVLAAGKGTRMKSATAKVLHKVAGRSMLGHAIALANGVDGARIAAVISPEMEAVRGEVSALAPDACVYVQLEQRGTADAVLAARESLMEARGPVVVLYADTPLIEIETVQRLLGSLSDGAGVCVLGFEARDPTGYGRLLRDDTGAFVGIREHGEASAAEREITLCNSGVMGFKVLDIVSLLERIDNDNTKGEFYLTDAVEAARNDGLRADIVVGSEDEVLGVNSRDQLAEAENIWQMRARDRLMRDGVTMISPETVWLSFDTKFGRDVEIEPNVFFGPGVVIEDNVRIKANCHFEGVDRKGSAGVVVGKGAEVGPFARLRPGAKIGDDVDIGNFVEVKNSEMKPGSKANHLSYIGDATIGTGSNIGAGTIFCNYDGFFKYRSELGAGVFIGSNSSLVGPVKVGDGAYVAAGSVVSKDVSAGALAIERSEQVEHLDWATKFKLMMQRRKASSGA